jgi:two-component system, OmpR family, response regulator
MAGAARLLVVHAEPSMRGAIAGALRYAGFVTQAAATGRGAERAIDEFRPDLVVLDVMLPDLDGFEVARALSAARPRTPVILVSERDATRDKIAGLAVADDYVTRPFSLSEIVARVRAVLRRTRGESESVLRFADLVLDERRHEVRRAGEPVELTPREFGLLRFFMLNPHRVLTKHQILANVWEDDFDREPSVVETYVSYLRKKLDRRGPPLIQTVRLVGYALREPAA